MRTWRYKSGWRTVTELSRFTRPVFLLAAIIMVAPVLLSAAGVSSEPAPLLEIRLQNHVTTYSSRPGSVFRCVVIHRYEIDGKLLIPQDSLVFGRVAKVTRVGLGLRHERAGLELTFDYYETPDGQRYPLHAALVSIDNSREKVQRSGRIKGVLAANNPTNLLNGFWAKPDASIFLRSAVGLTGVANQIWAKYSLGPIGAAAIYALHCALTTFPDPEIHLPPGTDMKLQVEAPLEIDPLPEQEDLPNLRLSETAHDLPAYLRDKLDLVSYANGRPAPDLFNVVLLGSEQQLESGFVTSGWARADKRSLRTSSRVYAAFSAMRSYAAAPVSRLFYHGAEPDLIFEKSFDTVTQRHHIRLWRAGTLGSEPLWLGAATHDTGVKFKVKSMRFTHKIDPRIDREREKVATDLRFTHCSAAPAYIATPTTYRNPAVETDGRLALLISERCETPETTEIPPRLAGNKMTRFTRRAVLETRNYIERDNAYYWSYQIVAAAYRSRQKVK